MKDAVTALIADDEPVARAGLRDLLAEVDWLRVVGECASGPDTVEKIDALRPEVVFLDIQMPGMLGTDVLRHVTHQPLVIFTTAYGQHAAAAFELGALDYLLKPFAAPRLLAALERVRAAIGEPVTPSALDRVREVLSGGPMTRLFVRSGRTIVPVAVADVAWFESLGDYVVAHLVARAPGTKRHTLHLPLQKLETRLDAKKFARIHRTHIVNLDHVKVFRREGKGRLVAELADGTRLAVSRQRAQELRALAV